MNIVSEIGSLTNWLAPKGWRLVGFENYAGSFTPCEYEGAGIFASYEGRGTLIFYGNKELCQVEVEQVEMEGWLFHVLTPNVNPDFYHEVQEWKMVNRHA